MARPKKDEVISGAVTVDIDKWIGGLRKDLDSVSFASSRYSEISEYIDTGDYGLNRLISGSINGGVPSGRITVFAGESSSGKTWACVNVIKNALNKNGYTHVFYFDSEGGAMRKMLIGMGIDINKVEHILVATIEDATAKILQTIDKIIKLREEHPEFKFMLVLDSVGGLITTKVLEDALGEKNGKKHSGEKGEGKLTGDMGQRAKLMNTFVKALMVPTVRADVPFLMVNHVYVDPNNSKVKVQNQGGGKGVAYAGHINIQCSCTLGERNAESKGDNTIQSYKQTILRFFTVKNRVVQPYFESEMYLDFRRGPAKYYGLFPLALRYGLIKCPTHGYYQIGEDETKYRMSHIIATEELWKPILAKLDELSINEMKYSTVDDELDSMENDDAEPEKIVVEPVCNSAPIVVS